MAAGFDTAVEESQRALLAAKVGILGGVEAVGACYVGMRAGRRQQLMAFSGCVLLRAKVKLPASPVQQLRPEYLSMGNGCICSWRGQVTGPYLLCGFLGMGCPFTSSSLCNIPHSPSIP